MARGLIRWCLVCVLALAGASVKAAPEAELWARWAVNNPGSVVQVDHGVWDRFLSQYVNEGEDGINRLSYGAVTGQDHVALDGYVQSLSKVLVARLGPDEQRAFWINLYNALTVQVVLDHYPVSSIREISISPGLFSVGPWKKKLIVIEDEQISLDDIEHRILRPIWADARIHYALNCAALGCPNLQRMAFTATNSSTLLDRAARAFVNHPRGVMVEDGRVRVSSLYVWFEADFGDGELGVLQHLRTYAEPTLKQLLASAKDIDGDDYDWSLNGASAGAQQMDADQ
ncbi:MAG: hypothetical protein ACI8PT_004480 [Gammaproteobacteria bacterium]|jgi:hypothetical protein